MKTSALIVAVDLAMKAMAPGAIEPAPSVQRDILDTDMVMVLPFPGAPVAI